jgi:hypothetical protein
MAGYTGTKGVSGKPDDNVYVGWIAGSSSDITLDSGKVIPKIKKGFKATEAEKASAGKIWEKLSKPEKDELREFFDPQIAKWKSVKKVKSQLYQNFKAGTGGKNVFS